MANTKKTNAPEAKELKSPAPPIAPNPPTPPEAINNVADKVEISQPKVVDNNVANNLLESINSAVPSKNSNLIDRKTINSIPEDELIPVKSVYRGGFVYKSKKTGNIYEWSTPGQIIDMSWGEIVFLNSGEHKNFLTKPFLIIEDGRAITILRFVDLYKKIASIIGTDLYDALNNRDKMKVLCKKAKETKMELLLADRLSELNKEGSFDSNSAISIAEKILGIQIAEPILDEDEE